NDVEIATGSAGPARVTFALIADARAVFNAGRDADADLMLVLHSVIAAAGAAGFHAANRDLCLFTEDGFFEFDGEIVANVAALLYPRGAAIAAAHVENPAKENAEYV